MLIILVLNFVLMEQILHQLYSLLYRSKEKLCIAESALNEKNKKIEKKVIWKSIRIPSIFGNPL